MCASAAVMATSRSKRVGGGRGRVRDDELLIQAKYSNKLPDVPFAPKFLEYPFDPNRYDRTTPL